MLERFESINKIGLFETYSYSSGCDFGEVTIIYGENGVGKSTIAAILDSLRERNAVEIIRRRSLPGDVAPTAALRVNGKVYVFDGIDWNEQLPYDTIDVFYPGFVTRNVHAATAVDPDQRRHLCELVLGREAVKKVTRLAQADNDGRAELTELKAIEKDLQLLIKKPDTLETFLGLPNDSKIDESIEKIRTELKQSQSKDAILTRAVPRAVALPSIDRSAINKVFQKTAGDLGRDFGAIVREHIDQHLDIDGESWLAYGARHTRTDNKCPFCAQDIARSNLVVAIRSYFSEEYRAYLELLTLEIQALRGQLDNIAFSRLRATFSAQFAVAVQWSDEMQIDQSAIDNTPNEAEELWRSAAEKMEAQLASKLSNPLETMEPALSEETLSLYETAVALLVELNNTLATCSKKADERKAALSKADSVEIEQHLSRLENQKARYEPLAADLLGKRVALIERRTGLDKEKSDLKKDIDDHASRVVGKYQAGINYYLAYFGCDIRIESIEPKFPSGKASVQYTLKAHGHKIDLGLSEAGPSFETVLSEGDKYTLALSFFFARLKDHSSLSGRIVVLDDPVNSLGSSRRTLIEGVIRDLRSRGAQTVVLTHDERLAAMMWRDKKLKDIVSLQVGRTNSGSQLLPWDIDRETQTEYVEHYLTLVAFLEKGGDYRKAGACIRPYLEQRLRHLYPGPPFETRDTLGQLIAKVRDSTPNSRLHVLTPKLMELEAINSASLPSHHATDDVPGMDPLSPDAVRIFAQKALDVLG